jgi:GAF domain-containing protein
MAAKRKPPQVKPLRTLARLEAELKKRTAERDDALAQAAEVAAERDEALAQQTATAEVLGVINSSPGDLGPVFNAILEKARSLCDVTHGALTLFDGEYFRAVATHGYPEKYADAVRTPFRPRAVHQRLLGGERYVHFADAMELSDRLDDDFSQAFFRHSGLRTLLHVPLRKDEKLTGYISAARSEVRPFSEKEIALLENFAAQAVIAMENARLITETREALEQQTATAEVLAVVNSSPGDLVPVFDAMLEKAMRLCEASFGVLSRIDGDHSVAIAGHGLPPELAERMQQPRRIVSGNAHFRLVQGEDVVQVEDITADDLYRSGEPGRRAMADIGGARTVLFVALRKDDATVGAFVAYRTEVRPFTVKQIALLQNFAAQAVIAMENARLLGELRQRTGDLEEALNYQTATSEVLKVISQSDADLAYVLQTALDTAASSAKPRRATSFCVAASACRGRHRLSGSRPSGGRTWTLIRSRSTLTARAGGRC